MIVSRDVLARNTAENLKTTPPLVNVAPPVGSIPLLLWINDDSELCCDTGRVHEPRNPRWGLRYQALVAAYDVGHNSKSARVMAPVLYVGIVVTLVAIASRWRFLSRSSSQVDHMS